MKYEDLVTRDTQTCEACPTQWEGTLMDGRSFYFRYRHGWAYLGVADTVNAAVWAENSGGVSAGETLSPGDDGYLDDNEYREVFVKLYNQLA